MELSERAAYIRGLMDGLDIDASTKEGKVLRAMSELLTELAEAVEIMNDDMNDMCEDLGNIEDDLYGDDEDEDEEEEDEEDEEDEDSEDDVYELTCPECGTVNLVTMAQLESMDIKCAECGKPFEFEIVEEDEEDPLD